jgi:hypothetical protein
MTEVQRFQLPAPANAGRVVCRAGRTAMYVLEEDYKKLEDERDRFRTAAKAIDDIVRVTADHTEWFKALSDLHYALYPGEQGQVSLPQLNQDLKLYDMTAQDQAEMMEENYQLDRVQLKELLQLKKEVIAFLGSDVIKLLGLQAE